MVDRLGTERRSWLMSRVKSRDTAPELRVRYAAHSLGLRFRLHRKDLPGKPDLVFPRWRVAIFVHGCFWHQHEGCRKAGAPKSRSHYWKPKLEKNIERDKRALEELDRLGWKTLTIWQCETNDATSLTDRLRTFFEQTRVPPKSWHRN